MTDHDGPLVTVCVPVYNGQRFLAQCLDSLLSQSFRNFVLLISDNASTDGTAEICGKYVQSDSRVRYHRNPTNIGLYGNYEFLLRSVRTRYAKIANADDFWAPTMLGDAVEVMEREPSLVLCHPRTVLVDENGREIRRYEHSVDLMDDDPVRRFKCVLTKLGLVNHLSGVMRTETVRSTLPLMREPGADSVFLAELSLHGKILELQAFQYFRRFHEGASSWNRTSDAHQLRSVSGEGTREMRLQQWKRYVGLIRRLLHSPVGFAAKLKLLLFLGRQIMWNRSALLVELRQLLCSGRRHSKVL